MAKYMMKMGGSVERAVAALLKIELSLKHPGSQFGVHAQPFKDSVYK